MQGQGNTRAFASVFYRLRSNAEVESAATPRGEGQAYSGAGVTSQESNLRGGALPFRPGAGPSGRRKSVVSEGHVGERSEF